VTHQEKVQLILETFVKKGIRADEIVPPILRLFWRIGLKIPPPLLLGFLHNVLFDWFVAMIFGGIPLAATVFVCGGVRYWPLMLVITSVGLCCGVVNAILTRWKAVKLKMPLWNDLEFFISDRNCQGEA
jgi:hypothetical protein